jgi:carbamoyltransferase
MNVLGINYYFHDSSACLMKDGKLIAMMEEERLSRKKHTSEFPERSVTSCLKLAGIEPKDVDHIALSIEPSKDWFRKSLYCLRHLAQSKSFLRHELVGTYYKQRRFWEWFNHVYPAGKRPTLHFVPHHASHAAGSFLVSPYERAALLSLDGSGEWATSFLGSGVGLDVSRFRELFSDVAGLGVRGGDRILRLQAQLRRRQDHGSCSHGDPAVFYRKAADIVRVSDDGDILVDLCTSAINIGDTSVAR